MTITASNATRQYGQPTPSLNNASYSGFVNRDTVASLSGALVCTTAANQSSPVGTYAINCSGLSSPNYSIIYVPGQLNVTPAPLTITAHNATRPAGQPNPAFTVSYTGFVNGDTPASLSGVLNCTTTAIQSSPAGTYPTNCSGLSSPNYTITNVAGVLTITPTPLTITASNATKILNALLPSFAATYSGFVNGEGPSALNGLLNCTANATTASPVGSYAINCVGQSSTNYNITYKSGVLRIIYQPGGICDGDLGHVILPPISANGTSVLKQGRAVPAKFRVRDANGVSIGTPGVVASFYLTQIIASASPASVSDAVSSTTPDTAFRWDSTDQQWIFNISTANLLAGQTYVYTITLNDGSTIVFQYGLR